METVPTTISPGEYMTRSADIVSSNLEKLRRLFPDAVNEDGVNVDTLRALVGYVVTGTTVEKYGLNWHGKRQARQLALTPSTGTLRPNLEESVSWDNTRNLVIEGDNLETLKLLQKSYAAKVKLVYIDPPYNTGKDFVYPDDFRDNIRNYLELTGQLDGSGRKITSNTEVSGRFHTDWLSMMYPRLMLARHLLKPDGLLFVSIDDNEEAALRFLLDDIFGEDNRVSTLVWHLGTGPTAGHFLRSHETVLCYARDKGCVPNFVWRGGGDVVASALKRISAVNPASDIRFPAGVEIEGGGDHSFPKELGGTITQTTVDGSLIFHDGKLTAPVTIRAGWAMKTQIESWLRGDETYDTQSQRVARIYFSRSGMLMYQKERGIIRPRTVLLDVASTADGSNDLERCGVSRRTFDFPKPVALIRSFVEWTTDPTAGDIVLDFFAGSGTTGHAVLDQNASDSGNRRFICVQLPEPSNKTGDSAPSTIAETLKQRLRGAGRTIGDAKLKSFGDTGFRVFRLDSSNIRTWDTGTGDLDTSLFDNIEHIKPDRSEADVLHELLLKLGLDLCVPIEQATFVGKTVYSVGGGVLMACLSGRIGAQDVEPLAQGIATWYATLSPAGDTICVFRDSAFADDVAKSNAVAILQQHGIASVRSL